MENIRSGKIAVTDRITPLHAEYSAPEVNRGEILRYAGIPASVVRAQNAAGFDDSYLRTLSEKCAKCGKGCNMSVAYGGANGTDSTNSTDSTDSTDDTNSTDSNDGTNSTGIVSIPTHCTEVIDDNASEEEKALERMLDEAIRLATDKLTYRVSYCVVKLEFDSEGFPILPFKQHSEDLKKNLSGCKAVVLFAATIGSGIDMLIRRYERTSPARGLIFQGMGAERVEALCDCFNDEVDKAAADAGLKTRPRYSPGYGDLSIEVQPYLLGLVDAQRRLGITLNDSFLMSPSKSVTAIIGIAE